MAKTVDRRINLYINGKEVQNNIKTIAGEYKRAKNELSKLTRGSEEYNKKAAEVRKMRGILDEHNRQIMNTQSRWQKTISTVKNLLPAFSFAAIIGGTTRLIQKWTQWKEQLEETRHEIHQLTGLTGEALEDITAKTTATSKTFKKENKEIIQAANTLSKQMNITFERALNVIQDGFIVGADSSDEFMDMLKEYPAQFSELGVSAEQSIAIMSQQVKEGVFSDKGIDALKEANIRIREMTDATSEAFESIGMDAEKVQEQLMSGDKSMFEIIQQVSGKLSELPPQSKEVGQAIADIFGGPGEDAGLKYLSTLSDINSDLGELKDETDEYARLQGELAEANERVSDSMQRIFGKGSAWQSVKVAWKEFWAAVLEQIQMLGIAFNRIGDMIGLNVKPLTEYSDVIMRTNPELRELSNRVKEFGVDTDKGREALTKMNSVLYETYGSEGLKIAQKYTEEQKQLAKQRRESEKEEEEAITDKTKAKKEDGEVSEEEAKEAEKRKKELIKQEKKLAEKIKEIRSDLNLSDMSDEAAEIQEVKWKYEKLIAEAEGFAEKQKELEELKEKELQQVRDRHEKERLEKKKKAEDKIQEVLMSDEKKELHRTREKYEELIKLAEKYGFDTAELYEKMHKELERIRDDYTGEERRDIFGMTESDWDTVMGKLDQLQQFAGELSMAWSAYNQVRENQMQKELQEFEQMQERQMQAIDRRAEAGILTEEEAASQKKQAEEELNHKKAEMQQQQAKRDKALRSFQVAVDTATAIVRFLADPGGLAGVALSAMAGTTGAMQLAAVNSEPIPQYEEGGRVRKNQIIEVAEGNKEEGIISNRTLTDPETGPLANYLLDKQAGVATSMPDTGAISKAAEYNNYKRNGGQYAQSQNVTNNYITQQSTDEEMKELLRKNSEDIGKLKTIRAVISNDMMEENEEEQRILNEINTMK